MKSSAFKALHGTHRPTAGAAGEETRDRTRLQAIAGGDRAAFESLYLDYHARLAGFVWHRTGRRELADEVINDTFWVVWKRAADFRGDARPSTWIIGIAYRCMLKVLRTHDGKLPRAHGDRDDIEAHAEPEADSEVERRELCDWVQGGLELLPPDQRQAIELAYFHGRTCSEIADIMGCATGTVKARLFHARARLRNTLRSLGGDDRS